MARHSDNPPPSDIGGANAFAMFDQQRKTGSSRAIRGELRTVEMYHRIEDWLRRRPELCVDDEPCRYAVQAVMSLRRAHFAGDGAALAVEVAILRRRAIEQDVARRTLTQHQADALLAGRWPTTEGLQDA